MKSDFEGRSAYIERRVFKPLEKTLEDQGREELAGVFRADYPKVDFVFEEEVRVLADSALAVEPIRVDTDGARPLPSDVVEFASYLPHARLAQHDVGGSSIGEQPLAIADGRPRGVAVTLDDVDLNPLPSQDDTAAYLAFGKMKEVRVRRSGDVSRVGGGPVLDVSSCRADGSGVGGGPVLDVSSCRADSSGPRASGRFMFNDNGFQGRGNYGRVDFGSGQETLSTDAVERPPGGARHPSATPTS